MEASSGASGTVFPILARTISTTTPASARPMPPPSTRSRTASASTRVRMLWLENPMVLRTAELRNTLPHRLRHGVAGQKYEREKHRSHDRPDNQPDVGELTMSAAVKDCSVCVLVSWSESADSRSTACETRSAALRSVSFNVYHPTVAAAERRRLIEIVPVEEHDVFLTHQLGVLYVIDTHQVEGPGVRAVLLRENRRFQGDLVPDLPVEFVGEALSDNRTPRVCLKASRCSAGMVHSGNRSRKFSEIASLGKKFFGS